MTFPARIASALQNSTLRLALGRNAERRVQGHNVRGAQVVPLPQADECRGFGGLFAVKHGDISGAILDQKLDNLRGTQAEMVVGCALSCLMHLQGGLSRDGSGVRCVHLAEVLAAGA